MKYNTTNLVVSLRQGLTSLLMISAVSFCSLQCTHDLGVDISGKPIEEIPEKPDPDIDPDPDNPGALDFDVLMTNIRDDNKSFPSESEINNMLKVWDNATGSFTDINYKDRSRTNWDPIKHIERLSAFVYAYTNKGNPFCANELLYNKIVKGLNFWYDENPNCSNWWYNQIGEPQKLGLLLLQMRLGENQIPEELEKKTLGRMAKDGGDPGKWTGANRSDIALHCIYRACLSKDEALLNKSLNYIYELLRYTEGEGIQYDNSYFQHGKQLYIGGYGDELIKGIVKVSMWTRGTAAALPADKLKLLSVFVRDTYYRTIWGGYMSFHVLGRGVSRMHSVRRSDVWAKKMKVLDPTNAADYDAIIKNIENPGCGSKKPSHKHFYIGDYTSHIRPNYSFDVRISSVYAAKCENGNGENLKGYFIADGSTNIAVDGDEYYNIFPYWNWTRIPGTTAPQIQTIPLLPSTWEVRGVSTFAGGVSDGLYGASAYSYYDKYKGINTGGNKSWFFFDDEIVCLGNVLSSNAAPLNTTINQCNARGGIQEGDNPKWVYHNKVGYIIPENKIWMKTDSRSGKWSDINKTQSSSSVSGMVFSIGIEHEKTNALTYSPYSYIVVPGLSSGAKMSEYVKNYKNVFTIVQNTEKVQSVYHKKLDILQTIFFASNGELKYEGIEVKADKRCALMLNLKTKKLHIANPSRSKSMIEVSIKTKDGKTSKFRADFSDLGVSAGKTLSFNL